MSFLGPYKFVDIKTLKHLLFNSDFLYTLHLFLTSYLTGTFGQVLECWDLGNQETVAIKIVRSLQKYREAAMIEIDVLQKLSRHDITGSRYETYLLFTCNL